ncbi:unnamed protein product [Vitrella brassicaformis CCMP3155]|uniref:thioredoxin-dependent peroxiredoxin n=1 Tax=Vitrella brassicaformis (strain CCMP3155) TaxID=1169540 RepID=A0A0G4FSU9_VITBC|nr:unnamed protein product [Vitrella brassicaformis CCMP3155]|mmetsp:Transcript_14810/g.35291  ORF Transcript_14810/g.35291 Transcript_14810/m.35291 type:complete len:221 (-) Transcript_14810:519-1181(-)|eukprot:CEM17741.1 unnamed protein product [Vitrella brassicaformis CCMP3155]
MAPKQKRKAAAKKKAAEPEEEEDHHDDEEEHDQEDEHEEEEEVKEPPKKKGRPKKKAEPAAAAAADDEEEEEAEGDLVGQTAPDFELDDHSGEKVKLSDVYKDKGVIIFFYPKANTGGCTTQAKGFAEVYEQLGEAGFEVFGMSLDKTKAQSNWHEKIDLPYSLLCGTTEVLKSFGVLKAPKSIKRSHVIIERGGKVKAIEVNVKPKDSPKKAVEVCCGE